MAKKKIDWHKAVQAALKDKQAIEAHLDDPENNPLPEHIKFVTPAALKKKREENQE